MVFFNTIAIVICNSFVMITHIIKMFHVEFLPSAIIFKNKFGLVFLLFRCFEFLNVNIRIGEFFSLLCKW